MQKVRHFTDCYLISNFSFCFITLFDVSFQPSLSVLFLYRSINLFRFNVWSHLLLTKFHVLCYTLTAIFTSIYRVCTSFDCRFLLQFIVYLIAIWSFPFSLTTTHRISIDFFSLSYWDVSIHRVPSLKIKFPFQDT